jgi:hypothetical protein
MPPKNNLFDWSVFAVHAILGPPIGGAAIVTVITPFALTDERFPETGGYGQIVFVLFIASIVLSVPAWIAGAWLAFRARDGRTYCNSEAFLTGAISSAIFLAVQPHTRWPDLITAQWALLLSGGVLVLICRWLLVWSEYLPRTA